jgi:hypothetical protein
MTCDQAVSIYTLKANWPGTSSTMEGFQAQASGVLKAPDDSSCSLQAEPAMLPA